MTTRTLLFLALALPFAGCGSRVPEDICWVRDLEAVAIDSAPKFIPRGFDPDAVLARARKTTLVDYHGHATKQCWLRGRTSAGPASIKIAYDDGMVISHPGERRPRWAIYFVTSGNPLHAWGYEIVDPGDRRMLAEHFGVDP